MELIIKSSKLESEFERLFLHYNHFYFITAWAGISSKHFDNLIKYRNKIEKIIVGIHFYQTHPNFIETFLHNKNVKFILNPQGIFHPKLYLFYNSIYDWEILMGSSNFTKEAFNKNTEANTIINCKDSNSTEFLQNAFKLIEDNWKISKPFSDEELKNYRSFWKKQRLKIKSLSGLYGSQEIAKQPSFKNSVINMTWDEFIAGVRKEGSHHLNIRLNVINNAKNLFNSVVHFHELGLNERKFIAGAKSDFAANSGYFGSMVGRGDFIHEIINNNKYISYALDQIPAYGQITRAHYDKFIFYFSNLFSNNYIGVASRLLAMKRPDVFYCLTSKNQKRFCKDFNISKSEIDYKGYWEHVIERIFDSEWWLNPTITSKQEQKICNARAAFLDAIYYEE